MPLATNHGIISFGNRTVNAKGFTTNEVVADVGAIKSRAKICSDCQYISANNNQVKYRVPHFSSYAIGSNSNMTIDANDPKAVNQTVTFTAVYRNSTSGDFISGATCDIGLDNGTFEAMGENTGDETYTYQTSFPANGTYTYNVTCSAAGYNTLKTDDEFTITEVVAQIPEFGSTSVLLLFGAVLVFVFYKYKN